ncbi:MAG: hypothetical protein LUD15_15410 [Bacteroides sp.]|nr:hypothetical protein [Bacteroides sp.]
MEITEALDRVNDAISETPSGYEIEVTSDNMEIFDELKDYIGSLRIGFREIYKEELLIMQFKVPVKISNTIPHE